MEADRPAAQPRDKLTGNGGCWVTEEEQKEIDKLIAELDAEEFEGGYPWPNL